jgi:hypothetical protein
MELGKTDVQFTIDDGHTQFAGAVNLICGSEGATVLNYLPTGLVVHPHAMFSYFVFGATENDAIILAT